MSGTEEGASAACCFAALDIAHSITGRVRFRYVFSGKAQMLFALLPEIEALPGVRSARLNPRARALIVHFDARATNAFVLHDAILRLAPAGNGKPSDPAQGERFSDLPSGSDTGPSRQALSASLINLLFSGQLPPELKFPPALFAALPVYAHALEDLRAQGLSSHVLEAAA
ncbi:MAG: hypothetical protein LBS89_06745, partial [Zoogloeaceae bacterium]|nr:hypothetical protein [Zoogloeaceae bacterium]